MQRVGCVKPLGVAQRVDRMERRFCRNSKPLAPSRSDRFVSKGASIRPCFARATQHERALFHSVPYRHWGIRSPGYGIRSPEFHPASESTASVFQFFSLNTGMRIIAQVILFQCVAPWSEMTVEVKSKGFQ